ncbi:STAS-like domain-containing protein [Burkholderia cenocepacia]|nr:STAS-like domain-containing protein [Burkholderia cenocepacia]
MAQFVLAKQFSRYPAGRFEADGPFSGELFRRKYLSRIVNDGERVTIFLDGARGYGSSFLEEAFGGLVREGFTAAQVRSSIELISSDQSLLDEIWEYVDDAEQERLRNAQ